MAEDKLSISVVLRLINPIEIIQCFIAPPIVLCRKKFLRVFRKFLIYTLNWILNCYSKIFQSKRPHKYYIEDKVDLTLEYYLNDESTITILSLLGICYSVIFFFDIKYTENNSVSTSLKLFALLATFLWLFFDIVRKVWNIWRADKFSFGLKTDPEPENGLVLSKNIKLLLDAESEGYQEEKGCYFNHIEKTVQKIHQLYGIKKNSDMNLKFFQDFAEELRYDVQIVDPEYISQWTGELNGIVYNSTDPAMRRIYLAEFSDKDKKTIQFLLHEMGHVLFGYSHILKDRLSMTSADRMNYYRLGISTERDANYFAAAMLCCEYKFKSLLVETDYDLIKIMNDEEYKGLSYETIAHRTVTLSEIKFHVFKMDEEGSLLKCFTNSELDYNSFIDRYKKESSAWYCLDKKASHHIGGGIYTKISTIPNKIGLEQDYFCFAKELTLKKDEKGQEKRTVYVIGCSLEDAQKNNLKYYKDHLRLHPEDIDLYKITERTVL